MPSEGGKAGIFRWTARRWAYVKTQGPAAIQGVLPERDAELSSGSLNMTFRGLEPQVAFPHLPSNTKAISKVGKIKIDQAVIGSCTNGRLEDIQIAAKVLKGKKVHPQVRCIIIPGLAAGVPGGACGEGLVEPFINAGAVSQHADVRAVPGWIHGILAAGERCVSTTNRNFVGRMGQHQVRGSTWPIRRWPRASAIAGRIAGPGRGMSVSLSPCPLLRR